MKKRQLFVLSMILGLALTGCQNNNKPSGDGYVDELPASMNDGTFIQAFNWKYSQVKDNLPTLADQGFRGVQISPVQVPKSGGSQWYFFYQPCSFYVAEKTPLGTKEELKELCDEAEKYGIAIIVDVVANHMASTGQKDEKGLPIVDPEVRQYEQKLYDNQTTYFHQYSESQLKGSGLVTQYYPYGVLPDLNTGNEYVQERVLNLLKECIDLGVDGFRFDAAKHIETPKDPQYPSDFWPNTLGVAKEYYKTKTGNDLFAYGEILGTLDGGRIDMSIYTDYMKVSDDAYIQKVNAGISNSAQTVAEAEYCKDTDPSNLIIWSETHDTYETAARATTYKRLARQWAMLTSRKGTNPMFLARPDDDKTVGIVNSYDFEKPVFGACNRFHNRFIDAEEALSYQGDIVYNERYSDSDCGAMVIDVRPSQGLDQHLKFAHLKDGTYYDQVTNAKVVVKNGETDVTFDETGVMVLTKSDNSSRPTISVSQKSTSYTGSLEVKITVTNAKKASYKLNDGKEVSFKNEVTVTIDAEGTTELAIRAENGGLVINRFFKYKKISGLIPGKFNIVNLNPSYLTDYDLYVWAWTGTASAYNQDYEWNESAQILLMNDVSGLKGFLLAIFNKGNGPKNGSNTWKNPVKQSADIDPNAEYFDASDF